MKDPRQPDAQQSMTLLRRTSQTIRRRLPRIRRFVVFAGPATGRFRGAMARHGAELIEMTRENADLALSFRKAEVVTQLKAWLTRGARGWFAVRGETVLGYAFLAITGDRPQIVRHVLLYPGEAGGILLYTRPHYRKAGVGPAFIKEILARAADIDGIERVVLWTVPAKKRWARALTRYGFEPAGSVVVFEAFGRSIFRLTRGSNVKR